MKKIKTVGEQIRILRKRAKLSQMELENKINTGYGSISRIENNDVNPTKETLFKIAEVLNLPFHDISPLFGFDSNDFLKVINLSAKLNNTLEIDTILQKAVNDLCFELNLLGIYVSLLKGDRLFAQTFTQSWYTKVILKTIGVPISDLSRPIENDSHNLMVKSILTKKIFIDTDMAKFNPSDMISDNIIRLLQKLVNGKSGVAIPIIHNDIAIGAIFFAKSYIDNFENELPFLKAFTEHIAFAIHNAQEHTKLKDELESLKSKMKSDEKD